MPKCRYYSVSLYAGLYDPVQDKIPPSLYVDCTYVHAKQDRTGRPLDP